MEILTVRSKYTRLIISILGIVVLANLFEGILIEYVQLNITSEFWHEVLNSVIILFFATPVLIYSIRKSNKTATDLQTQLVENEMIQRKLRLSNIELEYNASHDYLTGLPNRYKLFQMLDKLTAERSEVSVLFIDLDRFKVINDTMGHLSGDQFI